MSSVPTNVRFPRSLDADLSAYAQRAGARKSTVVLAALREWLRMKAHPGIVFVTSVNGERRAALSAGAQVWTVAEAWEQHDRGQRTVPVVAEAIGLSGRDVETALGYWAHHREEIDELVARHHDEQDEALVAWERRRALDAL